MNRYKLIIAVLAIAIVILGVPRLLLVPYLEREFESELAASLQASEARVEVQTPWGWELLWGRIPRLDLTASDAVIDGLKIAQVHLRGEQLRLDPRLLWQEKEAVLLDAADLRGEIIVQEQALNEFLWEKADPDKLLHIEISPQGVDLVGVLNFWNIEWKITVRGELKVHNGTSLRYVMKDLGVQETRIPNLLLEVLSENYELVMDFGAFPYPVEIKDVHLEEQKLRVILGGVQ